MTVSIIIPTAGTLARRSSLLRAIQAVLDQDQVDVIPIVVVNGHNFDASLLASLKGRDDIRFFHIEKPSLPGAINFGRCQVDTPFFGFVDDDDLYHPWAVAERLKALKASPDVDVVVSWGERESNGGAERVPAAEVWKRDDPLAALLQGCWLASCSGLFRTATVSADYFDPELHHLEWTSVALRLTLDRSLMFLESGRPHFLIADSPGSLSKSSSYFFGMEQALDQLLTLPLPPPIRQGFIRKKMSVRHELAVHFRDQGSLTKAWKHHVRTFYHHQGFRYLPSTIHFLRSVFTRFVL